MIQATTSELLRAMENGETSQSIVSAFLARIEERDEQIGAFLQVQADEALAAAREVDRKRDAGEALGPLAGIPVAIKDNINVRGAHTTCASRMLEAFVAPYDATVIEKLRAADAILIGKTNLDEFAMGSSTEHSALRTTRNPVNPDHVPGGSSGGSTAAVAAAMAPLALGSSTGGSIRQPAAFCGVVGLKPTYGRVSRYGLTAFGSSLDQVGPVAADVDGVARLLQATAGFDPLDPTSADVPLDDYVAAKPPSKIRIGIAAELMGDGMQSDIRAALDTAVDALRERGAEIVPIQLPHTEYAIPAYYLIATAEASSNLARFDGARYTRRAKDVRNLQDMYERTRSEGFGMEVKRRILLGTYCLSSGYYEGYYLNAQRVRTKIVGDFETAFQACDAILAPTTPTTAFRLGEKTDDPMSMYLSDVFTVTANLAGIPAISLPAGKDADGLPIGLQLMGPHFQEAGLLGAARLLESVHVGADATV